MICRLHFIVAWTLLALILLLCSGEEIEVNSDGSITTKSNEQFPSNECVDNHSECAKWMNEGECEANPGYMLDNCRNSCNICLPDNIKLGAEQDFSDINNKKKMLEIFQSTVAYVRDEVWKKDEYLTVRDECVNRHEQCTFWVAIGECEENPEYMLLHCAPSCQTCHLIDFKTRCPLDPNAKKALGPGDLNKMFERLANSSQYDPVVLSRPSHPPSKTDEAAPVYPYQIGPWVMVLENFLTDKECQTLIELGAERKYEQSTDVGEKKFDGTYDVYQNPGRTSKNTWCKEECFKNSTTQQILTKIETLTGIPKNNSEDLQLLRYEEEQFYMEHHDYIEFQRDRQAGVRALTVFLYLNDVEEGGETGFPLLDLIVTPKRGRALLWPNVLDSDPNEKDGRTNHEAMPVIKGVKYGANAWLHQGDFHAQMERNCN